MTQVAGLLQTRDDPCLVAGSQATAYWGANEIHQQVFYERWRTGLVLNFFGNWLRHLHITGKSLPGMTGKPEGLSVKLVKPQMALLKLKGSVSLCVPNTSSEPQSKKEEKHTAARRCPILL